MDQSNEARWRLMGVAVLAGAALVGAALGFEGRPEPYPIVAESRPISPPSGLEPVAADEIVVHVAGAVLHPGLVRVAAGSRVADVVAAAGGATAEAAMEAINLAAVVVDGSQVVIPDHSAEQGAAGFGVSPPGDGLVHVNVADAAELDGLPGVGPVLAERIVAHRDSNGVFESVEDLLDVPGIGESKLAAMRDLIAVP